MILLVAEEQDSEAAGIVEASLCRSFTRGQVLRLASRDLPLPTDGTCAVLLNPESASATWLDGAAARRSKVLLLGHLGPAIAGLLGVTIDGVAPAGAGWSDCSPALPHASTSSPGHVVYADTGFGALSPMRQRSLVRFDFADEWNNLGYGRISLDGSPWSICQMAYHDGAALVAELVVEGLPDRMVYAASRDLPTASLLWFNREVGPVDSQEWRLVETFFSDYRPETLPCRPHLREIPIGYDAAVTMRLDCDEAIASARPLFELYRSRSIPFSLAITTGISEADHSLALLREVAAAGGSILSHSHSHPVAWGGSGSAALEEALRSKAWLEAALPGTAIPYAVSPFHQTPPFALASLWRAGYSGVIGGSIASEPQHLLGRAGVLPFFDRPLVSHCQQCMLHGDCLADHGDPLAVYKAAFCDARRGYSIFGYTDHPFSRRYSYGWESEAARTAIHASLLDFFQVEGGRLLFMSETECLDFIAMKSACAILWPSDARHFAVEGAVQGRLALAAGYRGRWWPADAPVAIDG